MSNKQQTILSIFLSRVLYFGVGISYILDKCQNFSLFAAAIGLIIGFFILKILTGKDIYSFFKTKIGKLAILFIAFFLINNCLVAFAILGSNFYLVNTPPILIIIPLYLLILYGTKKGLTSTLRLSNILIFTSFLGVFLMFTSIFKNIILNNFLPIIIKNGFDVANGILASTILSISPIIALLALNKNVDKKSILKGYTIGSISIYLTFICIIGIFGSGLTNIFRYPEYILLKKITIFRHFEHLENFLAIIWFNDLLITSLICSHLINTIFTNKKFYLISIIAVLTTYFIFINKYQNILILYHNTSYMLLVPTILTLIFSKKNGESI